MFKSYIIWSQIYEKKISSKRAALHNSMKRLFVGGTKTILQKTFLTRWNITNNIEGYCCKCLTSSQYEFRVRIEAEAIHLCSMRIYCVGRFAGIITTCIPNHQFLVVGHRSEKAFVEQVPRDVFDYCCVTSEDGFCINNAVVLRFKIMVEQIINQ